MKIITISYFQPNDRIVISRIWTVSAAQISTYDWLSPAII